MENFCKELALYILSNKYLEFYKKCTNIAFAYTHSGLRARFLNGYDMVREVDFNGFNNKYDSLGTSNRYGYNLEIDRSNFSHIFYLIDKFIGEYSANHILVISKSIDILAYNLDMTNKLLMGLFDKLELITQVKEGTLLSKD